MQAYIPEFILAGLAMLLLLAETFYKKTPKFIFGLIGAAGTLAMLPFYMEGLYDNIYIILALVATAVTLLLSVDFRAVINLSSNVAALVTFIFHGQIYWPLGLAASVFSIAGHYTGAGLVAKDGKKIVRPVVLTVLCILFVKVIVGF